MPTIITLYFFNPDLMKYNKIVQKSTEYKQNVRKEATEQKNYIGDTKTFQIKLK